MIIHIKLIHKIKMIMIKKKLLIEKKKDIDRKKKRNSRTGKELWKIAKLRLLVSNSKYL